MHVNASFDALVMVSFCLQIEVSPIQKIARTGMNNSSRCRCRKTCWIMLVTFAQWSLFFCMLMFARKKQDMCPVSHSSWCLPPNPLRPEKYVRPCSRWPDQCAQAHVVQRHVQLSWIRTMDLRGRENTPRQITDFFDTSRICQNTSKNGHTERPYGGRNYLVWGSSSSSNNS